MKLWAEASEQWLDETLERLRHLPHTHLVRKGSWRTLFEFRRFPALCLIAFYMAVIYFGALAESYCAMVYVTLGFADYVQGVAETIPWLTSDLVAWALTFGFITGPFVLLKSIPATQSHAGKNRFYKGLRVVARVLVFSSPIVFGWVLGVEKDFEPTIIDGVMMAPPPTPGMIGYIITAVFLLAFSTTAASKFLGDSVGSFFEHESVPDPERVVAEREAAEARECLASCRSVLAEAEAVQAAAAAAVKNFETSCRVALGANQQDVAARKQQAFIIGNN